jgi:hypothetical protein
LRSQTTKKQTGGANLDSRRSSIYFPDLMLIGVPDFTAIDHGADLMLMGVPDFIAIDHGTDLMIVGVPDFIAIDYPSGLLIVCINGIAINGTYLVAPCVTNYNTHNFYPPDKYFALNVRMTIFFMNIQRMFFCNPKRL